MSRRLLAVLVTALLCGCSNQGAITFVPDGVYSGSTAAGQEVDLQVNGGEVKLQTKTLKRDVDNSYVEKKRGWRIKCRVEKPSKDIRCEWTQNGKTETIELMRL
jgi:hypothetical protein